MSRRPKLSLRKTPGQARSRATVDAILEATADILVRRGYAELTTNRIAERAGVNIASLYQYFPGKEAIVAELRRRHVAEQRGVAEPLLRELQGQGLDATIRRLVLVGITTHAVAPDLHRVLTEELPARRSRAAAKNDPLLIELSQFFEGMALEVPDRELALWMIDTVSYAVIHRAVVERPDDLSRGVLEKELVTLLLRYLRRGAARAGGRSITNH